MSQYAEQFFQWSLLGLITSGYFAVVGSGHIDLATILFTGLGLLIRALMISGVLQWNVSARWANAATLAYMGFYPLDYFYVSGDFLPATVHMIFFLAVLRFLTARTKRDYFFVKVIAFLELLAAAIVSSGLSFLIFLVLFLIFGVATFCCSEIRTSQGGRRVVGNPSFFGLRLAALTASVTLSIVVMSAGLFFLLPRTARAAFQNLVPQRYHVSGFSNQVTLGATGQLRTESTPVMHIRVDAPFDKASLKWRGAALTDFSGLRWTNPPVRSEHLKVEHNQVILSPAPRPSAGVRSLTYEVKMDAVGPNTLYFAGVPEALQINAPLIFRGPGDTYKLTFSSAVEGVQYAARAYQETGQRRSRLQPLPAATKAEHLRLPPIDSRIPALSSQVAGLGSPLTQAERIETYLATNYGYTLDLLDNPVSDPLAHFLFDRKQGHCEYFASAMAVMLRTLGIPSRVVTGFQGGVYNPLTGWQIIRALDAHSWVEAYIPGRGWTTFDPTPIDTGVSSSSGLFHQLNLYLDAADTFWQQWVMGYDLEDQASLASHFDASTFKDAADRATPYAAGGALLLFATGVLVVYGPKAWKALRSRRRITGLTRRRIASSDAGLLYQRMLVALRKRGFEKPAWLTPREFALVLPPSPQAESVRKITDSYHQLRYANCPEAGVTMLELIKQLERHP